MDTTWWQANHEKKVRPKGLATQLLQGHAFVEVFSGGKTEGGCTPSRIWDAAGGIAVRYGTRIGDRRNFREDPAFWGGHLADPKHFYHVGSPCHHKTIARITPRGRITGKPHVHVDDEETRHRNRMAALTAKKFIQIFACSPGVLVEQP